VNRRKFERHLRQYDCFLHHHGRNHDVWRRGEAETNGMVPRHENVKPAIVTDVFQLLGIPRPSEK
jgi:hypothetical protein